MFLYRETFDAPTADWRSWNNFRFRQGLMEIESPKPWRLYRRIVTSLYPPRLNDKKRMPRALNALDRLIGFKDRIDYNQVSGIGYLLLYSYVRQAPVRDVRGRTISFRIRGQDWKSNGSDAFFWLQGGRLPTSKANYAYTELPLSPVLDSGTWQDLSFQITASQKFEYAGNNVQQYDAARYAYEPIDDVLGNLANMIFVVVMKNMFDHWPSGQMQIDDFAIS